VTLREDLEVAIGGVQLRAIELSVGAVARVRATRTPDGALAYLHRKGSRGLPLVGIHGFGGDKETWLLVSALVDRRRPLALVDLPGHGRSAEVPEAGASIRAHAEAVLRVLDHAGIDRAIVAGNSMGGGVALRLARSWPSRVAALVLVDSVGRDVHDGAAQAWAAGDNPLIPRPEDIDRFMKLALERPPPVGRAVIRHVVVQRARRADQLHALFRAFISNGGDAGVPRDLGGIDIPTLVLHGEQDRIISKRVAEDLTQALPRAELVILRGVGHAPQLEAPRQTARLIEGLAARLPR
jgi:pimeloyl-ACP methyl ester carboxylesterase